MANTEKVEFIVSLTDEDIVERSAEQNQLLYEITKLEAERRHINLEIKPKNERVDDLMHIIRNREEKRELECVWVYDWEKGIKTLHRPDTGEEVRRDTIKDHEKQPVLFNEPIAITIEPTMFSGCPECLYVKTGNTCSSSLCGQLPPIAPKQSGPCEHPHESRVEESNVVTCGICKTVLDIAPITREMQPVNIAEEASFAQQQGKPFADLTPPDIQRECCTPSDRIITADGNIEIMHCQVCGLVHRKWHHVDGKKLKMMFPVGERFVPGQGEAA